jgi:hypothetical protein
MWGANAKFVITSHLPPIFHSVCMTSNYTVLVHDHGKNQENPRQCLVSADTNRTGLAARIATTCPSPCCFQLPRARRPPAYLTQEQWGEHSRSRISTVVATKATKPADDSRDDDDDNDEEDVPSIGKKGDDGVDDKYGVKEGCVLAAAKANKPGGDDSKDDDDDEEGRKGVKKHVLWLKGGKKHVIDDGDNVDVNNDDVLVWKKGGKKQVVNDDNDDDNDDDDDNEEGQKGVNKCIMGQKVAKRAAPTMVTMMMRTRTTRRCIRVARSGGTKIMTPPLPWAGVAHRHCPIK